MNIMHHIRTNVFKITQSEMAAVAQTKQATVSRWESDNPKTKLIPNREQLALIREEAARLGLDWSDSWFFESPEIEAA